MPLAPGTRVGSYHIVSAIGAGGMGEVYRATDTKLKRHVAIKILPPEFAADSERVARFRREAEVLASLNHAGIASIYGVEDTDEVKALVMELVDGPTLADRIAAGPIPTDEALAIGRQIAEAVEAAHAHGIVHRDLKPANIKVRDDGTVKVLDFGLAKALNPDSSSDAVSQSPTITSPATHVGVILGTAAYMSPEQARGKPLDKRTDIWSFGCVHYETLTGKRPFAGDDVSDVLASILAREPDFTALPADIPPAIRRLLQRCLQKDRRERLQDIGDARIEIRDALTAPPHERSELSRTAGSGRLRERTAWIVAVVAIAVAAGSLWIWRRPDPVPPEMRLDINLPPDTVRFSLALSPDGRMIAFTSTAEGRSRLWLHALESATARGIRGTEGASDPFWSPDSRHVAFFADGRLKRVEIDSESIGTITEAASRGASGSWGADDTILYVPLGAPIMRVHASGGAPQIVPELAQQGSNFSPHFLPDGHRFLYFVRGTADVRGVYVGDVATPMPPRRLLDSDGGAVYSRSGYLLFLRQGTLFAQGFDVDRLRTTGNAVAVAERVASGGNRANVSTSATGAILYRRAGTPPRLQFTWFDRSGRQLGTVGDVLNGASAPSLSRDGQRFAFYGSPRGGGNPDIWSIDIRSGRMDRHTSHLADDTTPVWSPDGSRIAFNSNRDGPPALYLKSSAAGGAETVLLSAPEGGTPTDWSWDGRYLLFHKTVAKTKFDVWATPMNGDGKPFPILQTEFDEQFAQFSPDGNWIAYQSDDSGRDEIYIQPFPGPGARYPVSTNGGAKARWRADGRELFYLGLDERLMAVPIDLTAKEKAPDIGTPTPLFAAPLGGAVQQDDFRPQYMVSRDGQRFLLGAITRESDAPATLILNWKPR